MRLVCTFFNLFELVNTKLTILRVFYQFIPNFLYVLSFYMFDMLDVFDMFLSCGLSRDQYHFWLLSTYIQQISARFVPDVPVSGTH